jgi:hypothetical protein
MQDTLPGFSTASGVPFRNRLKLIVASLSFILVLGARGQPETKEFARKAKAPFSAIAIVVQLPLKAWRIKQAG